MGGRGGAGGLRPSLNPRACLPADGRQWQAQTHCAPRGRRVWGRKGRRGRPRFLPPPPPHSLSSIHGLWRWVAAAAPASGGAPGAVWGEARWGNARAHPDRPWTARRGMRARAWTDGARGRRRARLGRGGGGVIPPLPPSPATPSVVSAWGCSGAGAGEKNPSLADGPRAARLVPPFPRARGAGREPPWFPLPQWGCGKQGWTEETEQENRDTGDGPSGGEEGAGGGIARQSTPPLVCGRRRPFIGIWVEAVGEVCAWRGKRGTGGGRGSGRQAPAPPNSEGEPRATAVGKGRATPPPPPHLPTIQPSDK